MKILLSIFFIISAGLVTFFITVPQFMCQDISCSFNGIKTLKENQAAYAAALSSAENLESKRSLLTEKYNSVSGEDRQRLEALLPNNADNIKLVLELETLAKRYGILIESPKLETQIDNAKSNAGSNSTGQVIRGSNNNVPASLPYGSFTLDFTVRASYENVKALVGDIEKNLRLIEPVSIVIRVPGSEENSKNAKKYPEGTYDITIKAMIYYLKN